MRFVGAKHFPGRIADDGVEAAVSSGSCRLGAEHFGKLERPMEEAVASRGGLHVCERRRDDRLRQCAAALHDMFCEGRELRSAIWCRRPLAAPEIAQAPRPLPIGARCEERQLRLFPLDVTGGLLVPMRQVMRRRGAAIPVPRRSQVTASKWHKSKN